MLFFVELTPRMQTTFPAARAFGIKICHRSIRLHGVRRQSEAATALWIGVPRLRGSSGDGRLKAELQSKASSPLCYAGALDKFSRCRSTAQTPTDAGADGLR